jgi:CBS domain-containing protein
MEKPQESVRRSSTTSPRLAGFVRSLPPPGGMEAAKAATNWKTLPATRSQVTDQSAQDAEPAPPVARVSRRGATVSEVMTPAVGVHEDTTIREVALIMAAQGVDLLPVIGNDNRLLGVVTDRNIVIRACAGDKSMEDLRAGDVMATDVAGIPADQPVANALDVMVRRQASRLPVVDADSRLLGLVFVGDIAGRRDSRREGHAALLEIASHRSFWS